MNISIVYNQSLSSLRQALNISMMQKVMNKDGLTVVTLINDMEKINGKTLEISIEPHKGSNIDIKL